MDLKSGFFRTVNFSRETDIQQPVDSSLSVDVNVSTEVEKKDKDNHKRRW